MNFRCIEMYNFIENSINYNRMISICNRSPIAFQQFYKITAQTMIDSNFPETIQLYLDQFIFDVRLSKQTIDGFCHMYNENLYFYVKIVCELFSGDSNNDNIDVTNCSIVIDILKNLKLKNFLGFVVIVTHFKTFLFLLDKKR